MKTIVSCAAVAGLLLASPAIAQFNYQSQDRYVEAFADGEGISAFEREDAIGFGVFDASVEAVSFTSATASQNSSLSDYSIAAIGHETRQGLNAFSAYGRSYFGVTFSVAEPVAFEYSSYAIANRGNFTIPSVLFTGPNGHLSFIESFGDGASDTLAGTLEPGVYTIIADSATDEFGSSFRVNLTIVPSPSGAVVLALGGMHAFRRRR